MRAQLARFVDAVRGIAGCGAALAVFGVPAIVLLGCKHHDERTYTTILPPPPQGCFTAFELPDGPRECTFQGGIDALIDGKADILRGCRRIQGRNIALVAGPGVLDCWVGEHCDYTIEVLDGAPATAAGASYQWDTAKRAPHSLPLAACTTPYAGPKMSFDLARPDEAPSD